MLALLCAGAGVAHYFGTGADPFFLAPLVSTLCAVAFVRQVHPALGYLGIVAAILPAQALAWSFFPFGGPVGMAIFATITALVGGIPFLIDRGTCRWMPEPFRALVLPVATTALEFVLGGGDLGSWGNTTYTQVRVLPLLQLVAVTGLPGLPFLIAWLASAGVGAWRDVRQNARPAPVHAAPVVALAVLLVGGGLRLALSQPAGPAIAVAAIGSERIALFPDDELTARWESAEALSPADADAMAAFLAPRTEAVLAVAARAARDGADLIAWGEGAVAVIDRDEAELRGRLRDLAREHSVALVASVVTLPTGPAPRRWDNHVLTLSPDGELLATYRKAVPTPGRESARSLRGDGQLVPASVLEATVGVLICYDMDFPELAAQVPAHDVDLIVAPAGDWPAVAEVHAQMSKVRGVEQGVPVVRPATGGVTAAFDALGRTLAHADTAHGEPQAVRVEVVPERRWTPYAAIGDVLGWLSLLGLAAVAVAAGVRRFRPSPPDLPPTQPGSSHPDR